MNKDDVMNLAKLSRLEISDADAEAYQKDFEGILKYVDTISNLDVETKEHYQTSLTTNMMREDDNMYEPGRFSEDILAEAPGREGNYIKVKKVL